MTFTYISKIFRGLNCCHRGSRIVVVSFLKERKGSCCSVPVSSLVIEGTIATSTTIAHTWYYTTYKLIQADGLRIHEEVWYKNTSSYIVTLLLKLLRGKYKKTTQNDFYFLLILLLLLLVLLYSCIYYVQI